MNHFQDRIQYCGRRGRAVAPALALALALAFGAWGCRWGLPPGNPPPGAIVGPETAPGCYTRPAARNRLVTLLAPVLAGGGTVRGSGDGSAELIAELGPLTGVRPSPRSERVLHSTVTGGVWRIELADGARVLVRAALPLASE